MVSPNDLRHLREKLERVRTIIAVMPGAGLRRLVAVDELESSIAHLDKLIARPTIARTYAASRRRFR